MPNKFFISDTHFFHENIIRFSGRPFSSIEEMNDKLVENWNKVVSKGDTVYHLGDVAFGTSKYKFELNNIFSHLNGRKILYLGNHDVVWGYNASAHFCLPDYFDRIQYWGIFPKEDFFCSHVPLDATEDNYRGVHYQLHGHIHQGIVELPFGHPDLEKGLRANPKYINVCVEHTGYAPKPLDDIIDEIKQRSS